MRAGRARSRPRASALVALSLGALAALACEDGTDPCDGPCASEPLAGVTAVAVGAHHGCALTEDAALYCWGRLPGTARDEGSIARLPTEVESDPDPADLFAGDEHSCVFFADGKLSCWGEGAEGRLGEGGDADRAAPVPVSLGGVSVRAGSGGEAHSCVVAAAATPPVANVHCWGRGSQGQLGRGGLPNSGAPAPVTGGGAYRGVATGGDHSCGIREDGALLCWGWNARGQLGLGVTFDVDEPLFVPGGLRWSALALGAEHSCALTEGGDAYCWGRGDSGQLGQGTTDDALLPVRVGGPVRFRALAAGREHTCGLTADGAAYCWGNGLYGRVGVDPVNGPFLLPTPVAAPTEGAVRFDQLAAGALHTCGLATEGTVFCWGFGGFGQLGTGATLDASVPTPVARPPDPSGP